MKSTSAKASYESLIEGNRAWVASKTKADRQFFSKLAAGQSPNVLWIGCSDSRVSATEITNTSLGEIFVHRNIANVCVHSDMNMLSVLDYAVNILKVQHIVVAGHYGCGGVAAALSNKQYGLIDNWLRHIKDVYRLHSAELSKISNQEQQCKRLVELNVIEQAYNLCKTTIVQNSWKQDSNLDIHGCVIDLQTGLLKDLISINDETNTLDQVHVYLQ